MKICVFANDFSYQTGAERVISSIVNALASRGHDIDILSLSRGLEPAYELDPGVQLYQLFKDRISRNGLIPLSIKRSWRFASSIVKIRYFFERHDYDLIIDTEHVLGLMAAIALKGKSIYKMHWEHINFNVDPAGSKKRKIRQKLAEMVDSIVVLTERDRQYWLQGSRVKGHVTTIYNPLPFNVPDVNYNADSKVVLNVGRFDSQKGYDLLLEAWSRLPKDLIQEGWTLKIVGNGDTKPAMEQLSRTLGVEDSVEMPPATKDVASYYRNASIFCFSSRFEGFGMVLIEAQAHGLPCISFDCDTGPDEIIEHGQNGFLVENSNVDALAQALEELMRSKSTREAMSESGLRSVTRFEQAPIVEQWEQLLGDISARLAK
ncbi:glycosyltransferase family 4 protein [Kushneria avicenniae]|nr:glycosyltransferase family 4 protein [Kushneria avicenniae]